MLRKLSAVALPLAVRVSSPAVVSVNVQPVSSANVMVPLSPVTVHDVDGGAASRDKAQNTDMTATTPSRQNLCSLFDMMSSREVENVECSIGYSKVTKNAAL